MNYRIVHKTSYKYNKPVSLCYNEVRLTPRNTSRQICTSSRLDIEPTPSDYREREDFFGNQVSYFAIQHPHDQLTVTVASTVAVQTDEEIRVSSNGSSWESVTERLRSVNDAEICDAAFYIPDSQLVVATPELLNYADDSFPAGRSLIESVHNLMQRINQDFHYDPGFSTISTPLSEVFEQRRGVCQDFAHLAIGCIRAKGLAARYVSGYLETLPPAGSDRLVGADASHAWFSVYVPDLGWVDFDPTNNQIPRDRHITLAWGRDYSDVTPLKGVVYGGGKHTLSVSVDVTK